MLFEESVIYTQTSLSNPE